MLEILGYMVVAYGVTRLLQTSEFTASASWKQLVGALGILALVILALLLHEQASGVSDLGV